jgi:hypothetical protein
MPRGAKPKAYPTDFVGRIRTLYGEGMTQTEVAAAIGTTAKVVYNVMRRYDIPRRARVKRDQRGPRNSSWRGDNATYAALHYRVTNLRGSPQHCDECGTEEPGTYEWASLTKNYADPYDYRRLCGSCHKRFDGIAKNLGAYAVRKEVARP